jgi:hypothetical protein
MKAIAPLFYLVFFVATLLFIALSCESQKDPYEEGMHFSYSIKCENGFVYKTLNKGRGTIQVLNSDGTPLRCGKKIY